MSKESSVDSYLKAVALKIRALRKERGYALADLGENIGLDKRNSFRLEQGINFTLITLIKIGTLLHVHPMSILDVPITFDYQEIEKTNSDKKGKRKINSKNSAQVRMTKHEQKKIRRYSETGTRTGSRAADA
jgi:transcriptional regulator with XRE-family HTH domain